MVEYTNAVRIRFLERFLFDLKEDGEQESYDFASGRSYRDKCLINVEVYCTNPFNSAPPVTCDTLSDLEHSDKLVVTCDKRQTLASLIFYS